MMRRILKLSGGFNFRDLGGYQGAGNRSVRWRRLLRTANLSNLTSEDLQQLQTAGVKLVIDLRSSAEVRQFPDQLASSMSYCHLPVFDNDASESAASTARVQRLFRRDPLGGYHRMLFVYRRLVVSPQAQQAYRRLLDILLNQTPTTGIIFHCSAGKDRTGMAAILILSVLGVSPERIQADYLLTNAASRAHIAQRISAVTPGASQQTFQMAVRDLASVKLDYYQQAFALINYEYGGIMAYLHDVLGVTDDMQRRLQQLYLD